MTVIEDTAVPTKCKNRAKLSLPPGLVVKDAGIPGAGQGVWAEKFFPKGVRFGPYGGEIVDEEVGRESGYAWEVNKDFVWIIRCRSHLFIKCKVEWIKLTIY